MIIKEEELLSKVIEAVRKGGYTNVYITDMTIHETKRRK